MKTLFTKALFLLVVLTLSVMCVISCDAIIGGNNDNADDGGNNGGENTENGGSNDDIGESPAPVIYSLELTADKTQAVVGEKVTLRTVLKSVDGEQEITDAVYTIVEGGDIATVSGNEITISDTATDGAVIKVKTNNEGIDSNVITITVIPDTTVESISIFTYGSANVVKGSTVALGATITPASIAESFIEWKITEGNDIASMQGTALMVSGTATAGATIKVRAYFGSVESNELVFTVVATNEEINAGKYYISSPTNSITVDKKGAATLPLTIEVYNYNFQKVEGLPVQFKIVDGADYLDITYEGYTCSFVAKADGMAKVEISIENTDVTELVSVDVIVPPESISIPEVFVERHIAYAFSLVDSLPFVPTIRGEGACTDLAFDFIHESGATGDEVAVYENGEITFKMTGKVIVSIHSDSGSKVEAKASYTFDINDGYNVYTFDQLAKLVNNTYNNTYNGNKPINIVVLEKPVGIGDDYGYVYGYDLVPTLALNPKTKEGQPIDDILSGTLRIIADNKSFWLNGNNHCIDVSQVRIFTEAEAIDYANRTGKNVASCLTLGSLLSAEPWSSKGPGNNPNVDNKTYYVKLYNVEVKGNCPIDYDPTLYNNSKTNSELMGVIAKGINVGGGYGVDYYVDINNITSSQFYGGIDISDVVGNGKVSNLYAYNCYSTGLYSKANIITFENLKFGPCGATAMELVPAESNNAGVNENENQKVTITGTFDASTNLNDGNTTYFQNYSVSGATVPQIISGNAAMYSANQVSHIRNENGQFIFTALIFNDLTTLSPNSSIVEYPPYMAGGIINLEDIPANGIDTTHQFIRMTIMASIPGLGQVTVGTALFYNMNYGK